MTAAAQAKEGWVISRPDLAHRRMKVSQVVPETLLTRVDPSLTLFGHDTVTGQPIEWSLRPTTRIIRHKKVVNE